jgi:hypothetical protein
MLATFADQFRNNRSVAELKGLGFVRPHSEFRGADLGLMEPREMEGLLADTVLKEFKVRLGRIGIEYQTPLRPRG